MRLRTILTLPVILIAVSACSGAGGSPAPGLEGTAWTVTSIGGTDTPAGSQPTITFDADGRVSGNSGCNQYTGTYETDGDSITVSQLASTMMACEDARMAVEAAFTAALGGATSWAIGADGNLELDGVSALVAEPAGDPTAPAGNLDDTEWTLAEIGGTADLADIIPTIAFAGDGTVSGFAGCNQFTGTYTVDGSSVTFGPLAATRMACEAPAGTIETEYLAALEGVTSWAIGEDGRLTLDGAAPLVYDPA